MPLLLFEHLEDLDPEAPDVLHLLPRGEPLEDGFERVETEDGRVFVIPPLDRLIAAHTRPAPIDIAHGIQIGMSPLDGRAIGWITELFALDTGLWGRVEWLEEGRQLVESKQFRRQSPTMRTDEFGTVLKLEGAGLTNNPALVLTDLAEREEQTMTAPVASPLSPTFVLLCKEHNVPTDCSVGELTASIRQGYTPTIEMASVSARLEDSEKSNAALQAQIDESAQANFANRVTALFAANKETCVGKERETLVALCKDEASLEQVTELLKGRAPNPLLVPAPIPQGVGDGAGSDQRPAQVLKICKQLGVSPEMWASHGRGGDR